MLWLEPWRHRRLHRVVLRKGKQGKVHGCMSEKSVASWRQGKMGVSDTKKNRVKKGNPTVFTPCRTLQHLVLLTVLGHY